MIDYLKCSRCNTNKPAIDFPVKHTSWCNMCRAIYYREWRLRNPDKKRAAAKHYRESHKDQLATYYRSWAKAHPRVKLEAN